MTTARFGAWLHLASARTPVILISGTPALLIGVQRRTVSCKVYVNGCHKHTLASMVSHYWAGDEWKPLLPWEPTSVPDYIIQPSLDSPSWVLVDYDVAELGWALTQPPVEIERNTWPPVPESNEVRITATAPMPIPPGPPPRQY